MSPEQARGARRSRALGHLLAGCVFFEMLAGRPPVRRRGRRRGHRHAHLREAAAALRSLERSVPRRSTPRRPHPGQDPARRPAAERARRRHRQGHEQPLRHPDPPRQGVCGPVGVDGGDAGLPTTLGTGIGEAAEIPCAGAAGRWSSSRWRALARWRRRSPPSRRPRAASGGGPAARRGRRDVRRRAVRPLPEAVAPTLPPVPPPPATRMVPLRVTSTPRGRR